MKLKNPDNEKYIKAGLTAACLLAFCLLAGLMILERAALARGARAIGEIVKPFLYGAALAYLLTPLCKRIEGALTRCFQGRREKLVRVLSVLASILSAFLLLAALLMLVIPQLWENIEQLAQTMPGHIERTGARIEQLVDVHPELTQYWQRYGSQLQDKLENWVHTDMPALATRLIGNAAGYMKQTALVLKNVFLGALISVYILGSRKRFGAQAKLLLHGVFSVRTARVIEKEVRYADRMFNGFLVGKIIDSAIIALICFAGCLVLRIDSPALIAVIIGVTNIIPFFGPFIGAIPCTLMLLLQNPMQALIFLIFVVFLQQFDGNVIGPRILGDTTGLSSFWVLFAILVFGGLWGVGGMIVGVPLFAVIYDIVRQLVHIGLGRHGRSDLAEAYREEYHAEHSEQEQQVTG